MNKWLLLSMLYVSCLVSSNAVVSNRNNNNLPSLQSSQFIENKGQLADKNGKAMDDIRYYANVSGTRIYFTGNKVIYRFLKEKKQISEATGKPGKGKGMLEEQTVVLQLQNGNTNPEIVPSDKANEYYNYYYAHCPNGISNVPAYGKLIYKNVYPFIDIVFHAEEKGMKYDFIVHPGGNPEDIRMKYDGVREMARTQEGKLFISHYLGAIEEQQPYTYQQSNQSKKVIASDFRVSNNTVGFTIGNYDTNQDLIIDPFATYYGGSYGENARDLATDNAGNIYMAGVTNSEDFPTQTVSGGYNQTALDGYQDAFIVKFNSNGVRQWATYYGGGDDEELKGIGVDANGNVVITGSTYSTNLPMKSAGGYQQTLSGDEGYTDAFILKLNSAGVWQWSTYYGGSMEEVGTDVAIDANGNVILTGYTESTNFPVQSLAGAYNQATSGGNETYDAFIVKFNVNGARTWATYYGGLGMEQASGIAVDGSNNVVITGQATFGLPLQTLTGAYNQTFQNTGMNYYDAFVLKFNASGARTWATYYGGGDGEYSSRIVTDAAGNILITGFTNSTNFPLQSLAGAYNQSNLGGDHDAYIVKFSSAGVRQWATYYGGAGNDQANSIATDNSNNILVCGTTENGGLPTLSIAGGYNQTQGSNQGDPDGFILKFNGSGVRQWATYYGNSDGYDELYGIAADNTGRVVVTGTSDGTTLPVQGNTGGYTQSNDYSSKAIIVQLTANGALATGATAQTITFNALSDRNYEDGYITLTATASSGLPVSFTVSGPASISGNELYFTGIGTVTVTASQSGNATYAAAPAVERSFCINAAAPYEITGDFNPCMGNKEYSTTEMEGAVYNWTVSAGGTIVSTTENKVVVNWTTLGAKTISVKFSTNCGVAGPAITENVTVKDLPALGAITGLIPAEGSVTEILPLTFKWNKVTNATAYDLYVWPASLDFPFARATNISDTSYTLSFGLDYGVPYKWKIIAKSNCEQKESAVQTFTLNCTTPAQPSVITPLGTNCPGEQSYYIEYQGGVDYTWTVSGGGTISGSGSFATVNWTTPGTYTITVTPSIACGKTGPARTLQVTITDKPVPAVVTNMLPANGTTDLSMPLTLSWNAAANADKYDLYIWKDGSTKPSGANYTGITTTSYTIHNGLEYGKLYRWQIVAKNDCKESQSAIQTLTLNCIDPPQPSVISGQTSVCPGKSGYSITGVQGVIYNWTVNNGAIITGVGTSVEATFTNPGTYSLTVTPSVGCGKTGPARTLNVTVLNTTQPAAVSNMLPVNGITTLTIPFDVSWSTAANTTSYDLYIWKQSEGRPNLPFESELTATLFRVESGVDPGVVYNWQIISKNTCKQTEGPVQTLKVICPVPEQIDTINGLADVCPGEWNYSVQNNAGENYQWSVSGGGTIIGSGASIKINWTTLGTHTVTVKPVAACGEEGLAKTLSVEVRNPRTVGAITNMLPANNSLNAVVPLNLSWNAATNADRYDLYIWPDSVSTRPSSPTVSNIKGTVYAVTKGLNNDVLYKWQIVARNNCRFTEGPVQKFKTIPLPDLYIASSSIPSTLTGGTTVTLTWEVKNKGLNSTGNAAWVDKVYLSNDLDLRSADDQLLATFDNVSYLQPGKSYIQTRDVTIPSLPGTYYLFITTDNSQATCAGELNGAVCSVPRNIGFHDVAESDEQNNYIYKVVNIAAAPAADLQVTSVGVPTTVFNGSTVNVNYFVKNIGQANAVGKKTYASGSMPLVTISVGGGSSGGAAPRCYDNYWYDMIYLSTDDQYSPETDINIGYSFVALKSKTQKDFCGNFAGIPLAIDSTYNMITAVNLPPKYVGNYYILVVAADQEGVDEAKRYGNNVKASELITINLTPPPDLSVTALTIPATAVSGQEANFSYTVKNIGASAPHPTENVWYDHIFISKKNTFIEDSCISIAKYYHSNTPAFLPDSFYTNPKTIKIPEGLAGNYYVYVVTDKEDKVFEHTFTANNIRKSTGTMNIAAGSYPDLEVLSVTIPDTIHAGKEFTVTYQVKNNGTGRASLTHYDQLYYSSENVWKPALGIKVSPISQVLESGQTVTRQIKAIAPEYIGDAWFFVFADYNNDIFENNMEANNRKGLTKAVYIKYAPLEADLEIPTTNFPVVAQSGSIINVSATIRNKGNEGTKAGTWADGFYLSSDTLLDANDKVLLLRYFRNSVLNPTATYDINANLELPQGVSGKYYIIFVADANKLISNETNRKNNYAIKVINISASPAPDLVVTSLSAPSQAFAGQKIKVKYTVKNQGGSDAKSKFDEPFFNFWSDGLLIGLDPALANSSTNIKVGNTAYQGTLKVNESYTDSVDINIPDYLNGNYYLFYCADNQNMVFENDKEDNNLSIALPIRITTAAPADLVVKRVTLTPNVYLGENLQTAYSIVNNGTVPAIGSLKNNIFLSKDQNLNAGTDLLLGYDQNSINLAPGDSIRGTFASTVTGAKPDTYYGMMHTNATNTVNEINTENNIGTGVNTVTVKARTLFLDVVENTKLSPMDRLYYQINVGADLDLLFTLTSDQSYGLNEVYIAYNRIPSSADFDYKYTEVNRPNQKVLVPQTKAGSYYVLIRTSVGFAGAQNIKLLAKALPFSIMSIAPNAMGQGVVSGTLLGAGFREGVQVVLRNNSTTVATAQITQFVNSMELKLKWNLTNTPKGIYDVVAINPGNVETVLAKGVVVDAAKPFTIDYIPQAPSILRKGKSGFYTFSFRNTSNVDIPVLNGDIMVLAQSDVVEVQKLEGKIITGKDYPLDIDLPNTDYTEVGGLKLVPFISRNLSPGQQITIAVNVGIKEFTYNNFPLNVRLYAYTQQEYMDKLNQDLEIMRLAILANPTLLKADKVEGMVEAAANRKEFVKAMLKPSFDNGLLSTEDTIGFDFACASCVDFEAMQTAYANANEEVSFNFDPGSSPGSTLLSSATFGPGQDYLWEINQYNGMAGQDPGFDQVRVEGAVNILATAANPFVIRVSSIDEDNYPGYLAGWYPAVNKSWPIVVAEGGINGFDPAKFAIDTSRFVAFNYTYGGKFSVQLKGTDTLLLVYTARIPAAGEPGIPGAPGGWGQSGSPGGQGGIGTSTIPAGPGGPGGQGGPGGGTGGQGGPGGVGTTGPGGSGGPGGPGGPGGGSGGQGGSGGTGPGGTGPGGTQGPTGPSDGGTESPQGTPTGTPRRQAPGSRPKGPGSDRSGKYYTPKRNQPQDNQEEPPKPPTDCNDSQTDSDVCKKSFDVANQFAKVATKASDPYSGVIAASSVLVDNCYANAVVGGVADGVNGALSAKSATKFNPLISLNIAANAIKFAVAVSLCSETDEGVKRRGQMIIDGINCINSSSGMELFINVATCIGKEFFCTNILSSCDPNEIIGPVGYGPDRMVAASQPMGYKVTYENDSLLATTAAQRVTIKVPVDEHLNPMSFRLGNFGFANFNFEVPGNQASYFTTVDLPDSLGYDVEVTAGVDVVKNELFWTLQTIDPATGLPPANPLKGYLPINDAAGSGEGYVTYTIRPKEEAKTGDTVRARASIVFDTNEPIVTNLAMNTLDAKAPVSKVNVLPAEIDSTVVITVMATDEVKGSGAGNYDLYVSENGKPFTVLVQKYSADKPYLFKGTAGNTYCFFSIARDNTGNTEAMKTNGEACTHVKGNAPVTLLMPNGGEKFCAGSTVTIAWTSKDITNVHLAYSSDNGKTYNPIVSNQAGTGTYTWTMPSNLIASDQYFIRVINNADANVYDSSDVAFAVGVGASLNAGTNQTVCASDAAFTLEGFTPDNGTWSGTGVSPTGLFTPATAGTGNHTLTYSVNVGDCPANTTKVITVTAAPVVTLAAFNAVSVNAAPFALSGGAPAGGTYTGMGVTNGMFNPASTGPGAFNITYTYNNGGTCSGSATRTIVVNTSIPAPTQLKGKAVSMTQINLTWLDHATTETAYVIERSTQAGTGFEVIATLPANSTSYEDNGLSAHTVYYYQVKAINATNASAYSNEVQILTDPLAIKVTEAPATLMNLYPNSVADKFTLEYNTIKPVNQVSVSIVNASGVVLLQRVINGVAGSFEAEFDVSDFAAGMYMLKLTDGEEMYTKVLVKE